MDGLEALVRRELTVAGEGTAYGSLLAAVMREQPEQRKRLPQAIRNLRDTDVLHEVVQRNAEFGHIEYFIMAGSRPVPPSAGTSVVSDG
ncbi:MAG: hypothetical protein J3T61_12715 [Candidatus Brocadiales bacterium]|nr:hypothetical protein [Candidatus Bathyanammoxibius sp.]